MNYRRLPYVACFGASVLPPGFPLGAIVSRGRYNTASVRWSVACRRIAQSKGKGRFRRRTPRRHLMRTDASTVRRRLGQLIRVGGVVCPGGQITIGEDLPGGVTGGAGFGIGLKDDIKSLPSRTSTQAILRRFHGTDL